MPWKPATATRKSKPGDAMKKIRAQARKDMQKFKPTSTEHVAASKASHSTTRRDATKGKTKARGREGENKAQGDATTTLLITTLKPDHVDAWNTAFYAILESHKHSDDLIGKIDDMHYRDFEADGEEVVRVIAACSSAEDAGVVRGYLQDVEVLDDVLFPQYVAETAAGVLE